jgi:hypothetical protein
VLKDLLVIMLEHPDRPGKQDLKGLKVSKDHRDRQVLMETQGLKVPLVPPVTRDLLELLAALE